MKSALLIVFDGFGIAPPGPGNASYLANPTNINSYLYSFPNTTLKASGEAVGLPSGEVGNTEVGHLNMGAGRVVYQDLPRINMSIADGSFFQNQTLMKGLSYVKEKGSKLHLIGLLGEGSVHSSVDHLFALIRMAKDQGIKNVFIHAITDGRDSPPKSAADSIKKLQEKIDSLQTGQIASVMGRYYGMDRDRRWDRIEKAYTCITGGTGLQVDNALSAVETAYKAGKTDEFIDPTNIIKDGKPIALIQENDCVIFYNFRIDRPRQLTKAFVLDDFEKQANAASSFDPYAVKYHKSHLAQEESAVTPPFARGEKIKNLIFITMTEYEKGLPVDIAFPPVTVNMPLGRIISENGMIQLRMSESEKERFVTFYFNGQREAPYTGEDHIIIPSPKVPTYDQKPEMSAYELTDTLIKKMNEQKYPFILINFANADMVGHTGSIDASIKAVKTLDTCLSKIVDAAMNNDYTIFITADHGNVEQKINPQTGEISTEHTSNPVPFIVINRELQGRFVRLQSGILADVAPTILAHLHITKPTDMTGRNLLEEIQ